MAGTGLIAIKRRIKSITNTKKITKAMGLVSTSKYRKLKNKVEVNNKYIERLQEAIKQVKYNYEDDSRYILGNNNSKKLYIALTSDTGLCGGFNWLVVNEVAAQLKAHRENFSLIVVGQKGRSAFNKLNIQTVAEYVEIPDEPSQKEANTIINHALNMYNKVEVGEVYVVYTKLVSAIKNEVKVEKLLPLNFDDDDSSGEEYVELQEMDEKTMDEIIPLFLDGKMQNAMLHSKTSEQRARMESMGAATNNANDLLEKLNLKYNRIRQSAITQEISEIVGGAEAQR